MAGAKVAFLTGLPEEINDIIVPYTPEGWTTQLVDGSLSQDEQKKLVEDADFIMVYRAKLTDDVLQAAKKARLVQLLAAGYDSMNLRLMRDMEIPCANNGGANSWAVADHAVLLMLSVYKQLIAGHNATGVGPAEIAADIPAALKRVEDREKEMIDLCQSPDFTVDKLRDQIRKMYGS